MLNPVRNKHPFKLRRFARGSGAVLILAVIAACLIGYMNRDTNRFKLIYANKDVLQTLNQINADIHKTTLGVGGFTGPIEPTTETRKIDRKWGDTGDQQTRINQNQSVPIKKLSVKAKKRVTAPLETTSDVTSAVPTTKEVSFGYVDTIGNTRSVMVTETETAHNRSEVVVPEIALTSTTTEPMMPDIATSFEDVAPIVAPATDATKPVEDIAVAILEDPDVSQEPQPSPPGESNELDDNGRPIPTKDNQSSLTICDPLTPIAISISAIESGCTHRACCLVHIVEPKEAGATRVPDRTPTKESGAHKHPAIGHKASNPLPTEACCTASEITLTRFRLGSDLPSNRLSTIQLTCVRFYRPYAKRDSDFCPVGRPPCPYCGRSTHLPP